MTNLYWHGSAACLLQLDNDNTVCSTFVMKHMLSFKLYTYYIYIYIHQSQWELYDDSRERNKMSLTNMEIIITNVGFWSACSLNIPTWSPEGWISNNYSVGLSIQAHQKCLCLIWHLQSIVVLIGAMLIPSPDVRANETVRYSFITILNNL